MKVYVQRPDHFFYYIVKMTADYCNFPIETVIVDAAMAEDAAFKTKKAHGNFPFAELADGSTIHESSAIAAYIARTAGRTDFIGGSAFEEAQISQLIDYTSADVSPNMVKVAYHTFGFT
jgi:glutathione S-transferase